MKENECHAAGNSSSSTHRSLCSLSVTLFLSAIRFFFVVFCIRSLRSHRANGLFAGWFSRSACSFTRNSIGLGVTSTGLAILRGSRQETILFRTSTGGFVVGPYYRSALRPAKVRMIVRSFVWQRLLAVEHVYAVACSCVRLAAARIRIFSSSSSVACFSPSEICLCSFLLRFSVASDSKTQSNSLRDPQEYRRILAIRSLYETKMSEHRTQSNMWFWSCVHVVAIWDCQALTTTTCIAMSNHTQRRTRKTHANELTRVLLTMIGIRIYFQRIPNADDDCYYFYVIPVRILSFLTFCVACGCFVRTFRIVSHGLPGRYANVPHTSTYNWDFRVCGSWFLEKKKDLRKIGFSWK